MSPPYPFVYWKAEEVRNTKGQLLFVSQRPWTGMHFRNSSGQLSLPIDALVDLGSVVTSLPVQIADALKIPRPAEDDEDAKVAIGGATGTGLGWIGPAEIAFPALGRERTYKIDCCFNPYLKYPILGALELFKHFRMEWGRHPESDESGYCLVPLEHGV